MSSTEKRITVKDFEAAWGETLSAFVKKKIAAAPLRYRHLTQSERDDAIRTMVDFLLSDFVVYAGEHRHPQWEKGWGENAAAFQKTGALTDATPRYFGKYPINRFRQELIYAVDNQFELGMLSVLQYWLFEKYLKTFATVYEFGCGTGHNLLRLREVNPTAELWGLDWATSSQKMLRALARTRKDTHLKAHHFDFFNPDRTFTLDPKGALYTFAALEQTGTRYKKFIAYLLKNKPALCVHIEPTGETLDSSHLLDYLSIRYFQKRKYLQGFITHLQQLEKQGKIEIVSIQRSYIGSFYIDGYSIIVWRPR